jgi:alkyl sulfatase BDS1-like metallo-beta-lactamase superfamily hydrolase
LRETARALRFIHDEVVRRLNDGQWPVEIVEADIQLPPELASKPFLAPIYGCTAFIVRDVIRPFRRLVVWAAVAVVSSQPARSRARPARGLPTRSAFAPGSVAEKPGELKRALAMAELAIDADSGDEEAVRLNAEILQAIALTERSFIARNLFIGAGRKLLQGLTKQNAP